MAVEANGKEFPTGDQSYNNNSETVTTTDIVYDETKPKRIQNPNKHKVSATKEGSKLLQDGIDKLISPDDDIPAKRSSSRRRLASAGIYENQGTGRPIVVYTDPDSEISLINADQQDGPKQTEEIDTGLTDQPIKQDTLTVNGNGHFVSRKHYQKSPENRRKVYSAEFDSTSGISRKCESPVMKLKSRSETSGPYNKPGRKISSNARLGGKQDSIVRPEPMRKISSHARLEHAVDPKDGQLTEEPKQRRVSFGTATYIHNFDAINNHDDIISKNSPGDIRTRLANYNGQKVLLFPHRQQESSMDTKEVPENRIRLIHQDEIAQTETDVDIAYRDIHDAHDLHAKPTNMEPKTDPVGHYDNIGYVDNELAKESDTAHNLKIIDSQTGTPMEVRRHLDNSKALSSSTESLVEFQLKKKQLPNSNKEHKASTHSVPNGFEHVKKISQCSDDASDGPKSILKVRKDDSASLNSMESANNNNSKVRRDSVALYHAQHSDGTSDGEKRAGSWIGISQKDLKTLWDTRYDLLAKYKIHVAVLTIFILTLIFVIVGVEMHKPKRTMENVDEPVQFDPDYRRLHLLDEEELDEIIGTLGLEIPSGALPSNCYLSFEAQEMKCLLWEGYAELIIVHKSYNSTQCYDIRWTLNPGVLLHDCYETTGAYWYGPANSSDNHWYLKQSGFSYDSLSSLGSGTFSTVTEYYWLSSKGTAVIVDMDFPVRISWNEKNRESLCISRSYKESTYSNALNGNRHVQYRVCNGVDMLETHRLVRDKFLPRFSEIPDQSLLSSPHWSLTPQPKTLKINDSDITDIVNKIKEYNLACSTVDIDWQWEMKYGDFSFNKTAFSNMDETLQYLSSVNCGLTIKVYPYVNYLSENFKEGLLYRYFVRTAGGNAPVLLRWEHGVGSMIDITNPDAQDWFGSKLRNLISSYNIQTLRFGYGSSFWLPSNSEFFAEPLLPNEVMTIYSKFMDSFAHVVLERTSQTQNIPSLISVQSEIIKSEENTCLKNIIPRVFTLGLLGYPFVISDGFKLDQILDPSVTEFPSKDLFIRWMQLSSFFPATRYTVKPWYYDEEVTAISKNMTKYHQEKVLKIVDSLKDEILSGEPIIRPMWWSAPTDANTYPLDDQFMLGDAILVAPVLCEGKAGVAERSIYFPKGIWRDSSSNALISGPNWIQYYKVKQDQIALFTREVLFEPGSHHPLEH